MSDIRSAEKVMEYLNIQIHHKRLFGGYQYDIAEVKLAIQKLVKQKLNLDKEESVTALSSTEHRLESRLKELEEASLINPVVDDAEVLPGYILYGESEAVHTRDPEYMMRWEYAPSGINPLWKLVPEPPNYRRFKTADIKNLRWKP